MKIYAVVESEPHENDIYYGYFLSEEKALEIMRQERSEPWSSGRDIYVKAIEVQE